MSSCHLLLLEHMVSQPACLRLLRAGFTPYFTPSSLSLLLLLLLVLLPLCWHLSCTCTYASGGVAAPALPGPGCAGLGAAGAPQGLPGG
jgi:hypothetical protein